MNVNTKKHNCQSLKDKEEQFKEGLRKALPPVFGRIMIDKLLPGIMTSKTVANLSALNEGPESHQIGRKRCYEREEFISWLLKRKLSVAEKKEA